MGKFLSLLIIVLLSVACVESEEDRAQRLVKEAELLREQEEEDQEFFNHMEVLDLAIEKDTTIYNIMKRLKSLSELIRVDSVPYYSAKSSPLKEREDLVEALGWVGDKSKLFDADGKLVIEELIIGNSISSTKIWSEFEAIPLVFDENTALLESADLEIMKQNSSEDASLAQLLDVNSFSNLRYFESIYQRKKMGTWDGNPAVDSFRYEVGSISPEVIANIRNLRYVVLAKTLLQEDARKLDAKNFLTGHIVERFYIYDLIQQETIGSFYLFVMNSETVHYAESVSIGYGDFQGRSQRDLRYKMGLELQHLLKTILVENVE